MPYDSEAASAALTKAKAAAPWVIVAGRTICRDGSTTDGSLNAVALYGSQEEAWRGLDLQYGRKARLYWMTRGYGVRRATWRERESCRLQNGTYEQPVWHAESFWRYHGRSEINGHYAHASAEDRGAIAFTESDDKGELDRQTRMKAGRYLKRFFGETLTDKQIAFYAEWQKRGERPDVAWLKTAELKFATTGPEMIDVYERGPTSCMHASDSVRVYAAGDLALAYLERPASGGAGPEIIARALVWPEKKALGRVYPNAESWRDDEFESEDESEAAREELSKRLRAAGYVSFYEDGNVFDGARMLAERHGGGGYVMPYIDKLASSGPHRGADGRDYFTLSLHGDFQPDSQDGRFYIEDEESTPYAVCERCDDDIADEDDCHTAFSNWRAQYGGCNDRSICSFCYEHYTFTCDATEETYLEGESVCAYTVMVDKDTEETWNSGYANANAFLYRDVWYANACASEIFPGFPAWLDNDRDAHPELTGDAGDPENLPNAPHAAQESLPLEPESHDDQIAF